MLDRGPRPRRGLQRIRYSQWVAPGGRPSVRLPDQYALIARAYLSRMPYAVKEIFYTLQGEGGQAGSPAVFCRFAGCNLWTGLEKDRHKAVCQFCDTQFVGTDGLNGGKFATPADLARRVAEIWDGGDETRRAVRLGARAPVRRALVVCTG